MAQRTLTINRCPLCGDHVEEIPPAVLNRNPHHKNVELVITRRGLKQYIHTSCWNKMIEEKRPYDGRLYM